MNNTMLHTESSNLSDLNGGDIRDNIKNKFNNIKGTIFTGTLNIIKTIAYISFALIFILIIIYLLISFFKKDIEILNYCFYYIIVALTLGNLIAYIYFSYFLHEGLKKFTIESANENSKVYLNNNNNFSVN